jgi:hypothetical protein
MQKISENNYGYSWCMKENRPEVFQDFADDNQWIQREVKE